MQGYGRGARMKIEADGSSGLAGVRAGETLGSPVSMRIVNRDWANWEDVMAPEGDPGEIRRRRVTRPRPGHADLVGVLKYDRLDARDILERASARETAARVAAGALARRLLEEFGVEIGSHVVSLGGVRAALPPPLARCRSTRRPTVSEVRMLDSAAEAAKRCAAIDEAKKAGDTLGGEVEVVARGSPLGLGSHTHWDRKLDGAARRRVSCRFPRSRAWRSGSASRRRGAPARRCTIRSRGRNADADDARGGFRRLSNNAGGLEGGMTTGEPLVVRVAMKPISTLMSPLKTVDLTTGAEANAQSERSDVTAVPAMGVIAEALVALVLADAMLEKFGGDSLAEMRRNYRRLRRAMGNRWRGVRSREDEAGPHRAHWPARIGKSTAGRSAAAQLGVAFVDLDAVIEREQDTTIAKFFEARGEPAFREIERDVALRVMSSEVGVVAPGGGWAAQPGALDQARARCFVVYLRTEPNEAARRVGKTATRPLLAGADPDDRMRELLAVREAFYLRAEAVVATDGRGAKQGWARRSGQACAIQGRMGNSGNLDGVTQVAVD